MSTQSDGRTEGRTDGHADTVGLPHPVTKEETHEKSSSEPVSVCIPVVNGFIIYSPYSTLARAILKA